MAWINLVAERAAQRRLLERDSFLEEGYEDLSEIAPVLLAAALADEPAQMAANADAAATLVQESFAMLNAGRMGVTSWHRYGEILTTAILMGACGHDTWSFLDWAQGARLPADRRSADLHRILSVALGRAGPGPGLHKPGHADETLENWSDIVAKATPMQLAELALCPDHGAWGVLSHHAAVAAFAAAGGVSATPASLLSMLAWAGGQDRAARLVHQRQRPREPYDAARGAAEPAFAQGFDAILDDGGETVCYYNMSLRFLAPWLCDGDLDAFWFLRWTDRDWETALADAADPDRVAAARSRPVRYCITYDPANAAVSDAHTARAAAKYGLTIEMRSFLAC